MAYKNRCTEWTNSGRRCKNKIRRCHPEEEYGKDICHIHYQRYKSATLKIEKWYYNLKYKKSVKIIEDWYYKILSLKRKAVTTIQLAWLKYKDIKCPICFENFTKDNIIKTDCGHRFCKGCLKSVFDAKTEDLDNVIYYDELYHIRHMHQLSSHNHWFADSIKCPICRRNIMDYDFVYTNSDRILFNCIFVFKTDKYLTGKLTYLNQKKGYLI
jgi:hypothetical protein